MEALSALRCLASAQALTFVIRISVRLLEERAVLLLHVVQDRRGHRIAVEEVGQQDAEAALGNLVSQQATVLFIALSALSFALTAIAHTGSCMPNTSVTMTTVLPVLFSPATYVSSPYSCLTVPFGCPSCKCPLRQHSFSPPSVAIIEDQVEARELVLGAFGLRSSDIRSAAPHASLPSHIQVTDRACSGRDRPSTGQRASK